MTSQKRLKELFHYDQETGELYRRWKGRTINGYLTIMIDGKRYYQHRVIWMYMHGRWPNQMIDHINGNRSDNKLSNLREVTDAQNKQNRKRQKNNTSGFTGVAWDKSANKWHASIQNEGKMIHLGRFKDPKEAHKEYLKAKSKLHKFWPGRDK